MNKKLKSFIKELEKEENKKLLWYVDEIGDVCHVFEKARAKGIHEGSLITSEQLREILTDWLIEKQKYKEFAEDEYEPMFMEDIEDNDVWLCFDDQGRLYDYYGLSEFRATRKLDGFLKVSTSLLWDLTNFLSRVIIRAKTKKSKMEVLL